MNLRLNPVMSEHDLFKKSMYEFSDCGNWRVKESNLRAGRPEASGSAGANVLSTVEQRQEASRKRPGKGDGLGLGPKLKYEIQG